MTEKFSDRECIYGLVKGWVQASILFLGLATCATAATFTVNSNGDAPDVNTADGVCDTGGGICTLRAAIQQANALPGADVIAFAVPGSGVQAIAPATAFPNITQAVQIDGWTQGGAGYTGPPLIELNGSGAASGTEGLTITANGSLIRGLIINRFGGDGIFLNAADGNTIVGCYIGLDATGSIDLGNTGIGIRLIQSSGNVIGGSIPADRNLISGNAFEGIQLVGTLSTNNQIKGNYVGTDVTGTVDLGNTHHGIELTTGPSGNVVGGSAPGEGNLISGNEDSGIAILAAANNVVIGNLVGTDVTGTLELGNTDAGIVIGAGQGFNDIGGILPGEGNTIAFNTRGVYISGSQSTGNSIRRNAIFLNDAAGIELGAFGPTANDPGDADTGSNQLQNFPVVTAASTGSTYIQGSLNSLPKTNFSIDFYSNSVVDASNHGEGEMYLGSIAVTTDAAGDVSFATVFSQDTPVGYFITATATDPDGNTSEFSAAAEVLEPTAANVTVGGRVTGSDGVGVSRAIVELTDQSGAIRETITSSFGYFRFTDVTVGEFYLFSVRYKSYESDPFAVFVADERDDINLEVHQ